MSVKIYEAYRFKTRFLNAFIDAFHDFAMRRVKDRVRQLMGKATEEKIQAWYKEHGWNESELAKDGARAKAERWARWAITEQELKRASQSQVRDLDWCVDVGLNIWTDGTYCYVIPHGEYWIREGFKKPRFASEFGYWNNTDRPDHISKREWRARERKWDSLCLRSGKSGWDARRISHDVVDMSNRCWELESAIKHKETA